MKGEEAAAGRRKKSEMEVNMTPLIDCVFLLLIFFMIATTFAPMPGIREQLILRISDPEAGGYGTMILNDQVTSLEMLLGSFQGATLKQKEMLIIQSGRQVLHEQIVKVMDLAKRADIKKIGFAMSAR